MLKFLHNSLLFYLLIFKYGIVNLSQHRFRTVMRDRRDTVLLSRGRGLVTRSWYMNVGQERLQRVTGLTSGRGIT